MKKLAVGVVAAVLLTGCSAAPTPTPEPTPSATPVAATFPDIPAGTVVATGTFEGSTTGTVELVVTDGGMYEVRLTDLVTDVAAPYSLLLSPYALTDDRTCLDIFAFDLGDPTLNGPGPFPIGPFEAWGYDPSFLDGAVLGKFIESDAAENDCLRTIVARAPFTWDFPDLRPDLTVVDSGPAVGAMGDVELEDGEPASYTVAPEDILGEIAARFGITVDDLFYLNPGRLPSPLDPIAYADEALNLSRDNR
ncbi:hypothetical protein BH10ACT7_BH10ACT7_26010 [soil metagenome]